MTFVHASSTASAILPTDSSSNPYVLAASATKSRTRWSFSVWLLIFSCTVVASDGRGTMGPGRSYARFAEFRDRLGLLFRNVVEEREAEKIEDIEHFGGHVRELDVAVVLAHVLNVRHEDAESGAADVRQVAAVHDDAVLPVG